MKPQTHTPGPWELRHERHLGKTDHIIKIGASAVYFQRGVGQTEAETVMNARLIASAPELLEHLKRLTNVVNNPKVSRADLLNISNDAMISISKAEGRI